VITKFILDIRLLREHEAEESFSFLGARADGIASSGGEDGQVDSVLSRGGDGGSSGGLGAIGAEHAQLLTEIVGEDAVPGAVELLLLSDLRGPQAAANTPHEVLGDMT